ncbi:hypothetical protein HOO68_04065 [Candidatus Gracilibacteria bacterium]|nr:hypothetical protein [Candidatus Gracilibacteria bacterium]
MSSHGHEAPASAKSSGGPSHSVTRGAANNITGMIYGTFLGIFSGSGGDGHHVDH